MHRGGFPLLVREEWVGVRICYNICLGTAAIGAKRLFSVQAFFAYDYIFVIPMMYASIRIVDYSMGSSNMLTIKSSVL